MRPDEEVIQMILAGDREAYARLVERYAGPIHALAYSYVRDADTAEEVAQEAFVKAFVALRGLTDPRAFGAWLAQITRNICRAMLRKRRLPVQSLSNADQPANTGSTAQDTGPHPAELREVLATALDALSPTLREAIVLFYIEQRSVSEVAAFLGISENTVKQRLHRGRAALQEQLAAALEQELPRIRPSGRLRGAVMAVLPLAPADLGWAARRLLGLAGGLMSIPWLGTLLVSFLPLLVMPRLMAFDVDRRYRSEFRRSMRRVNLILLVFVGLSLASVVWILEYPWLTGLMISVPLLAVLTGAVRATWLSPWPTLIAGVATLCMGILFCAWMAMPYRESLQVGFQIALLICLATPLLYPTTRSYRSPEVLPPPEPQPVSMDYLRSHAVNFGRILNAQQPWISDLEIEPDAVVYSTSVPRYLSWLLRLLLLGRVPGTDCRMRLRPDGSVEVDLPANWQPGLVGPKLSTEHYRAQIAEWVRRKWSWYLAGDLKQARAVVLQLYPEGFFKTGRSGFRFLRFTMIALLAIAAYFEWSYIKRAFIDSPAITTERLREFYQNEFLALARNHWPEPRAAERDYVSNRRMLLYYSHPPSVMSIPGVADVYRGLQKEDFNQDVVSNLRYRSREIINGLEAGYLTVPLLRSWGLTPDGVMSADGKRPDWAALGSDAPSLSNSKFSQSELDMVVSRVRLLRALGMLRVMDPHIPDEVLRRVRYQGGAFTIAGSDYHQMQTTACIACILAAFDRWDLADRAAVGRWLAAYPRKNSYLIHGSDEYILAIGLVATGAQEQLPLPKLAGFRPARVGPASRDSSWSLDPYDINGAAVDEILIQGRLLEVQFPFSSSAH